MAALLGCLPGVTRDTLLLAVPDPQSASADHAKPRYRHLAQPNVSVFVGWEGANALASRVVSFYFCGSDCSCERSEERGYTDMAATS